MPNPTGKGGFQERKHQIHRDGRPKNSVELGALFRRIGAEIATDKQGNPIIGPDGRPMTVVEAIARQKAQDKRYQEEFLDRGWGKVPQQQQLTGADNGPIEFKDVSELSDDDRAARIVALIDKARARRTGPADND